MVITTRDTLEEFCPALLDAITRALPLLCEWIQGCPKPPGVAVARVPISTVSERAPSQQRRSDAVPHKAHVVFSHTPQ